ncbi:ABC transporter permease [Alkalihalobacillus hwajinpoensis]|uniref:ABC transporter permease n=1 Tax=Guptibacillus hwajinpoensis TaxID=208199 RepID=UPI0018839372|nr:ABC transporter permease [Pseudalkalibacillus hwajinpoensis]MBF0705544.1 ABC transporter permease [Pseudalkalibacillus hwajinpoensis]
MNSMIAVLKEQVSNFYLINRLSIYQVKSTNSNNYLGMVWEILNPLFQMSIYWFVFGFGIRNGNPVDGVPFVLWMSAGLVVWFFFNPAVIQGSKSIYTRISMVSKMNFPMSTIPSYVIMSVFYQHLILLGIYFAAVLLTGQGVSWHLLQLPYYMFALIILIFAISLITSTLSTIVRDVHKMLQSFIRMFLYLTPILWTIDDLPGFIQIGMKLNPLYYIVEGYRDALLGMGWVHQTLQYTLYYWVVVVLLLMIGSYLHMKFKSHFVDYI